jgi:uncharacterized membrane protein YkvA (DUF1232 family)
MRISAINAKIKEALANETRTGTLGQALSKICLQNTGVNLAPEKKDECIRFIKGYVEYVPMLLHQFDEESSRIGIKNEIAPFIESVENYFFMEEDIIPDRYGLLGLIDDAYLANSVIAELSKRYRLKVHSSLTSAHIPEFNKVIRLTIGDPAGQLLDQKIHEILENSVAQNQLNQLIAAMLRASSGFNMQNYNHPIWGNASTSEIVDAQMGMLGFEKRY